MRRTCVCAIASRSLGTVGRCGNGANTRPSWAPASVALCRLGERCRCGRCRADSGGSLPREFVWAIFARVPTGANVLPPGVHLDCTASHQTVESVNVPTDISRCPSRMMTWPICTQIWVPRDSMIFAETRVRADAERGLLQRRDVAEAGGAEGLRSFGCGDRGGPTRGAELRREQVR